MIIISIIILAYSYRRDEDINKEMKRKCITLRFQLRLYLHEMIFFRLLESVLLLVHFKVTVLVISFPLNVFNISLFSIDIASGLQTSRNVVSMLYSTGKTEQHFGNLCVTYM